jgi:hypothetical protein
MADVDSKTCTGCGELKPASDFKVRKYKNGSTGLTAKCVPCERAYQRNWKNKWYETADKAKLLESRRKTTYGITREETIDMLLEQDFCCPICLKPLDLSDFCVDHNHETGVVRGLLNRGCNSALGKFDDNVATLTRAQAYLEVRG